MQRMSEIFDKTILNEKFCVRLYFVENYGGIIIDEILYINDQTIDNISCANLITNALLLDYSVLNRHNFR